MSSMLAAHGVTLVFDVGANCGQYGTMLREAGYRGRIVSFEPQAEAHRRLVDASQGDHGWIAGERIALGSRSESVTMNIAGNSVSSSILRMDDCLANAAPQAVPVKSETIEVVPLDDVAPKYIHDNDHVFLKIDTEGFEASVLDGASRILDRVVGVQLEMAFVQLFVGQSLFEELYERLIHMKFVPWAILPGFTDMKSGRMFQCDGVFFRDQPHASS
jgi:FkbM family methyltransferase